MPRTHVALLRGVNVGGHNKVGSVDLVRFITDLGFTEGATLLQSGNVVFRAEGREGGELETLMEAEAQVRLGLSVGFFVRSAPEWSEIVEQNPFPVAAQEDPSHLVLIAPKQPPDTNLMDSVRSKINGPERFAAVQNNLIVVYPDGIGTSTVGKTPGWNKLAGPGTARNWNTVLKLQSMLRG